jgi:hypothetical protein
MWKVTTEPTFRISNRTFLHCKHSLWAPSVGHVPYFNPVFLLQSVINWSNFKKHWEEKQYTYKLPDTDIRYTNNSFLNLPDAQTLRSCTSNVYYNLLPVSLQERRWNLRSGSRSFCICKYLWLWLCYIPLRKGIYDGDSWVYFGAKSPLMSFETRCPIIRHI